MGQHDANGSATRHQIAARELAAILEQSQGRHRRDELIRVTDKANAALLDLEELDDEELDATREQYEQLARDARNNLRKRRGHG